MREEIPTEPGIYPDLSDDAYFAIDAVSRSQLDQIGLAPNFRPDRYKFYRDNPDQGRESKPIYNANHALCFRPNYFYERYTVAPRRETGNRYQLNVADFELCEALDKARRASRPVRELLAKIERNELACIFRTPQFRDILRKAKFDALLLPEYHAIADLKLVSPEHLSDDRALSDLILKRGWHRQASTYIDCAVSLTYDVRWFVLLLQEDKPPYACRVVPLSEKFIELGERQVTEQMKMLKWCLDNDIWVAPHLDSATEVEPPKWAQLTEGMIHG